MITLKFTKNQGFALSVEDTFFEKLHKGVGGEGGFQIDIFHQVFQHLHLEAQKTSMMYEVKIT